MWSSSILFEQNLRDNDVRHVRSGIEGDISNFLATFFVSMRNIL